MLTKSHIALGVITALAVADDIRNRLRLHKAATIFLNAAEAYETDEAIHRMQIDYLCHILDKHGIPADEFDLIALNFHQE